MQLTARMRTYKKRSFPLTKIRRFIECKLVDGSRINRYSLFIFEVVKAHVATSPRYPQTVHYRGDGVFMVSGRNLSYRRRFKSVNL